LAHRASFSAFEHLAESVLQIDAQYNQQNDREDLLVVLGNDSRQKDVEVRSGVVCVTPGYSGQRAVP
jgi:hypothetical protein